MRYSGMLGAVSLLLIASAVWARPGTVRTLDGQTYQGDISEATDQVTVERKGIHITIPRVRVLSLSYADSVEQEYRRRLARLSHFDVPGRLELAHWLFERQAYALAADVLEQARQIQPRNEDVIQLLMTVREQVDLEHREARKHGPVELAEADNEARVAAPAAAPQRRAPATSAGRLLTPDEINFIKQSEWQGEPVRVKFLDDVRRQYVAREAGLTPAEFNRLSPSQQAWAIIKKGSDRMKKDVIILNDPPELAGFKKVQQQVLAQCANCHTAEKPAGNFALHFPADKEQATYTNFLILQRYSATVKKVEYPMINRERPGDSLLVQFALPPDAGDPPHPDAASYKGVLRARNDVRYKTMVDWISSLSAIVPDYSEIDLSKSEKAEPQGGQRRPPAGRGES